MGFLNWILTPKPEVTNFPKQTIPPKPLLLLEMLDAYLVSKSVMLANPTFHIHEVIIPLEMQHWDMDKIFNPVLLPGLEDMHMPRSIAFFITPEGAWIYLIGVYSHRPDVPPPTDTMKRMYIELLTRTNNARTIQTQQQESS